MLFNRLKCRTWPSFNSNQTRTLYRLNLCNLLSQPMNYAVLDKNALNTGAPKKPDRDAEESTAYASIDVGKVGQVEADLV